MCVCLYTYKYNEEGMWYVNSDYARAMRACTPPPISHTYFSVSVERVDNMCTIWYLRELEGHLKNLLMFAVILEVYDKVDVKRGYGDMWKMFRCFTHCILCLQLCI